MPDWTRFHAAVVAGSKPYELCRACELAWSWLDLADEEWRERLRHGIRSEAEGTWLKNALSLVRGRLLREHGIAPEDSARFSALNAALAEGRASESEVELKKRWDTSVAIGSYALELFPAGVANPPDPDLAALNASIPALRAAIEASGSATAAPASLEALHDAVGVFAEQGRSWAGQAATDRHWWLGLAWWAYGDASLRLGHRRDARDAMQRAAEYYDAAGDAKDAQACRDRASDIETRYAADFDSETDRDVRKLLAAQAPLERVRSLTRLVRAFGGAGDRFEARKTADEAAQLLDAQGYADPEHAFDQAIDAWIATAVKDCRQNALVARLCEITEHWSAILGARTVARLPGDAPGSARAERTLRGLRELAGQFDAQAAQANNALAQRAEVWMPGAAQMLADRPVSSESAQRVDDLTALDDELYRVRIACNEGASEVQLKSARELECRAVALGSSLHVARAMLEQVYVLLALRRFADVPALAERAKQTLSGDRPASLSAFATGFERELYLWAIDYKARAIVALGDPAAALALLEPVIRDIERERARVSSPYQQSAFLATRAEIYELAAEAAYRCDRIDDALAIGELLKARAALRSRVVPAVEASSDEIEARFRTTNDALARSVPGTAEERSLREERQWLLAARAIARARRATDELPDITVAALQRALAEDECAISWTWVRADAAIVIAISRASMGHAWIRLTSEQREQLDDYIACVRSLGEPQPAYATLIPRIELLIGELGAVLLPEQVRTFVSGKRLVLSPHRALHLFPFHAAPWRSGCVIDHFSVRYAPNLTSLLVPWSGNRDGDVLAVGVATFDDRALPELPGAETEATAVAAAHGAKGRALLDATREQFMSQPLADFRCVHLATHGSSVLAGDAPDDPMESCVYLRDGALSGFDLGALPLRAELVVLGACHSGQRAIAGRGLARLPGDDLFGLQGVLFEAGVGAVLGALWVVHDQVARAILTEFHRAYAAGAASEEALQCAVQTYRRQAHGTRGVFYWAPFYLSGLGRSVP